MAAASSGGRDYGLRDRGSRYRDLDDYIEFPTLQHKKKRSFQEVDPSTGFPSIAKTYAAFHVVEMQDKQKSFEQISPFFIEKALSSYIGQQHETKRLRNGTLLVKCKNEKQAQLLMSYNSNNNAILFGNTYKVNVFEHATLNTVEGLIYCWDAKFLSEDEILEGLQEEGVVKVRKIRKKVGDKLVDTALCILTFRRSQLPTSIKFGFHRVLVKTYIPNPLRCLNCFRFGHTRKFCKSERICASCSNEFHEPTQCVVASRCINCNGNHNNWNKECPHYKREVGIQKIKVQEKLSYYEAKKKYDSFPFSTPQQQSESTSQKKSYAQATANQKHVTLPVTRKATGPQTQQTANAEQWVRVTRQTRQTRQTPENENNTDSISNRNNNTFQSQCDSETEQSNKSPLSDILTTQHTTNQKTTQKSSKPAPSTSKQKLIEFLTDDDENNSIDME